MGWQRSGAVSVFIAPIDKLTTAEHRAIEHRTAHISLASHEYASRCTVYSVQCVRTPAYGNRTLPADAAHQRIRTGPASAPSAPLPLCLVPGARWRDLCAVRDSGLVTSAEVAYCWHVLTSVRGVLWCIYGLDIDIGLPTIPNVQYALASMLS
ncbi:hypothetical protein EVG20_g11058 [Dentipellis fragilis]|uniref:Uncharacterized protein n=1 Tax=Dentipellis fragilis TaxID=205917 RepID=A0A4Y9XPN3_9AGAM|nr:hypothetical protein EVG20_g11058 [Dentipellis fragilis]